jgi:hypothetical protein
MTDLAGKLLQEGDAVIFTDSHYRYLTIAIIDRISPIDPRINLYVHTDLGIMNHEINYSNSNTIFKIKDSQIPESIRGNLLRLRRKNAT